MCRAGVWNGHGKGWGTQPRWTRVSNVPLWKRRPKASLTVLGRALPADQGGDPSPLFHAVKVISGELGPVLSSPAQKRYRHTVQNPVKSLEDYWGSRASVIWREADRTSMVSLEKKRLRGILLIHHGAGVARHFSVMCREMTWGGWT